jgi:UDP-N-acetylglucosamine--N-acetylmuramyl-(pentapeptide) pyrophosphoryl-undecaprenol N-acetylglucosamine transferase
MKKRAILSAGGTGGHLFPAQSLAIELSEWEVLFVAGGLKLNRCFDQKRFSFEEVECATFPSANPFQVMHRCGTIFKGVRQSRKIVRQFAPDLVVGFGSFFTLPVLVAALFEKVPIVLHEQNAIPGKVNRLFCPFARTMAITFPITRTYLKGRGEKQIEEVLFPLRKKTTIQEGECWRYFGLMPQKPTLLVFGGSQGAESLNALFLKALTHLPAIQVLHFTGNEERTQEAKRQYAALHIPSCVKSFEPCMDLAMQIADFAITRAGASTIAELIEYELPALLIPYPFATQNHQEKNGAHFASVVRGGQMHKESVMTPSFLAERITSSLPFLAEMRKNIAAYKKSRHVKRLAELIEDTVR